MIMEKNNIIACSNNVIIQPASKNALFSYIDYIDKVRDANRVYGDWVEEQKVAKNIFDATINARNFRIKDMQIHCQAVDVFCGDMALTAKHPNGDIYVLFVDLTGHGLSAAIAILPVSDMFSRLVEKKYSAEKILQKINKKLLCLLPTSMFMACCMIKINVTEKTLSVWNAGMPDIYFVDKQANKITKRFISSRIPLGITELNFSDIHFETVKMGVCNQIFMLSDGVADMVNEEGSMLGASQFEIILQNNMARENNFNKIVDELTRFKGKASVKDDLTLITIPLSGLLKVNANLNRAIA